MVATGEIGRAVLSILLFAALAISKAHGGDAATRDIIGVSLDGRYFGSEQYGVQDGSGFPYSEIFVIDAAEDKWVAGTPIRKCIDNEKRNLSGLK